jgi:hypothetical protein
VTRVGRGIDLARLDVLTREIHADARDATRRHSHVEGAIGRGIVNRIRRAFDLDRIPYDGPPEDEGVAS